MDVDAAKSLVVHAPNIHTGGGLVLLRALLTAPAANNIRRLFLDDRVQDELPIPEGVTVCYVKRSISSRLWAEWQLSKQSEGNDVILCFHGLPPLFRSWGRVVVFIQNRILVNQESLLRYPLFTRIRLLLERRILRVFSSHVDKFIVQAPSMERDVSRTLGSQNKIAVVAFASVRLSEVELLQDKYDFVYVAGDDAHKNHRVLLDAWRLLADAGLKPSLALTLPESSSLAEIVDRLHQEELPHVTNLGVLTHREVFCLYASCSALIFPSYTESFGLPLIEAKQCGLPVLAPELDYVRDIVEPAETFDPHSPLSLARAVKRFIGQPESTVTLKSADSFLMEVMQ